MVHDKDWINNAHSEELAWAYKGNTTLIWGPKVPDPPTTPENREGGGRPAPTPDAKVPEAQPVTRKYEEENLVGDPGGFAEGHEEYSF